MARVLFGLLERQGMEGVVDDRKVIDLLLKLAPRARQLGKERLKRHQDIDDQETDDEEPIEAD